jgi:hypothetical protein
MPDVSLGTRMMELTPLDRAVSVLRRLSFLRLVAVVLNRIAEVEGCGRAVNGVVDVALDLETVADDTEDAVNDLPAGLG